VETLTRREREVLALMMAGFDRKEIARQLFLSTNTVRTHIQNLMAKLGVHSSVEAVSVALSAGLRPPRPPGGELQ
jgi:DNA-binding NarL/FixJ family response regulator